MPIAKKLFFENLYGEGLSSPSTKVGTDPKTGKSTPENTQERQELLYKYNKMREIVNAVAIPHMESTSLQDLENALKKLNLQPGEVGTITDYQARMNEIKGGGANVVKYGIYNTMEGPPGQHWFCCYEDYKYDPLGDDSSDTQEQPTKADDCGQRCLAYLLLCKINKGPVRGF